MKTLRLHRLAPSASWFVAAGLALHATAAWPSDAPPAAAKARPTKAHAAPDEAPSHGPAPPKAAAGALAAPAADAPVDPIERLRDRLADRLAGVKTHPTGQTVDLRVVSVAPTARAVVPSPTPGAAAHGGGKAGKPAKASAHWSYSGEVGPQAWGGLRPDFALCAKGERQSPIDIREGLAVDLEPVRFSYRDSGFAVVDNGHTVQVNLAPGNFIDVAGKRFELQQFHFHRPSEERIDGRQFEMSVHLVHKDAEGRLAVVGVLLGKGAAQPVLQTVWSNLPLEKHQEAKARATLDPAQLLPVDRSYYTYMGSLTTPPCSEGVQWVVMRSPVSATPDQIDLFSRLYPMNARPVQSASGRRILQSN